MKIIYRLSPKTDPDNKSMILIRFYCGKNCDQSARTFIRVSPAAWDSKNGKINVGKRYTDPAAVELIATQKKLDALSAFLFEEYATNIYAVHKSWLKEKIAAFHGKLRAKTRYTLADLIPLYIEKQNILPSTAKRYKTIKAWLQRFRPLYADTITTQDIEDLAAFWRKQKQAPNTIASKLKAVRAVCTFAVNEKYMLQSPFVGFKMPTEVYGSITFLTADERDKIAQATLTPALSKQRDVFLFQCWTGCRVSDLYRLTKENITKDGYLQYIQLKTRNSHPITVRVPLSPTALAIVEKYKHYTKDTLLPLISSDKYNESIKRIIKAAGIDRVVIVQDPHTRMPKSVMLSDIASSHLARRTFAENAFIASGSERIVSSMTGHSAHSQAFTRYTSVTDDMKKNALFTP